MDELRKISQFTAATSAEAAFKPPLPKPQSEDLPPPPPLPKLISIRDGGYYPSVPEGDILPRLGVQEGDLDGPSLEMVVVGRRSDDGIDNMPRRTFENMIRKMKIDTVTLQHLYLSSYGFFYYGDCDGDESFDNGTRSFFFGNFIFSVVWSFDMETKKTSAVVLLRTIRRHYNGTLPLQALEAALSTYKDRLNSPLSLAFILHTMLTHVIDENLGRIVGSLRSVEGDTDHGPSSGDDPGTHRTDSSLYMRPASPEKPKREEPMDRQDTGLKQLKANETLIDALTEVAKKLANVNVHLANMDRHAKLLKSMATTLMDESFRKLYCKSDEYGRPGDFEEDNKYFLRTLPSLYRRLERAQPTIEYLQGRAKGQHQVVFGLLTHEDAMVNLRVARANVSIASAARDDSSAMKTIALMTMIFLPGTFYAALFDQPTLNWEPTRPGVVQDGFGLYWALTVPSTLVVLITSWVMHRGWKVLGKERGQKAQKKWDGFKKKFTPGQLGGESSEESSEEVEKIVDNGSFKGSPV